MKVFSETNDLKSLPLSLSGVILGIMLAVADYNVDWKAASALALSAVLIHMYMASESRCLLLASVASSVLTVYLSYGRIFCLESLILLLFAYFVLRLSKGAGNSGRIVDGVVTGLVNGPVALLGAYFVCSHTFGSWVLFLPALSIGLLCIAAHGTEDGYRRPALTMLIVAGLGFMVAFSFMRMLDPMHFLYALVVPFFALALIRLYKNKGQASDNLKSSLVLYILALAVLTGIGFTAYLF